MTLSTLRLSARLRGAAGLLFAAAVLAAPLLSIERLSRFESEIAPVVRDFEITRSQREPDGGVLIWGRLNKVRNCRFLGATAYAGDPARSDAGRERLDLDFLEARIHPDLTRDTGLQRWGPWRISRPVTGAGPALFLELLHRCHPVLSTEGVYLHNALSALFGGTAVRDAPPGR